MKWEEVDMNGTPNYSTIISFAYALFCVRTDSTLHEKIDFFYTNVDR